EGGYRWLEPWVSGLVAELEEAMATTNATFADLAARSFAPTMLSTAYYPPPEGKAGGIVNAVTQLALRPSVQLSNPLQLERAITKSFSLKSDLGLQVAGTLSPEL